MSKKIILLPLLSLLLGACQGVNAPNKVIIDNDVPSVNDDTPFVYREAENEYVDVSKEGAEIVSISITGIPTSGIKAGCWDEYDIKFHVLYSDSTTGDFPCKVKHIPISERHYLGEIGRHYITMLVNGYETKFGFDICRNPDFSGFDCVFIDTRTSEIIYKTTVGYYQDVTFEGELPEDLPADHDRINKFIKWNYPLEFIHQHMEFRTVYKDIEKRYYGQNVKDDSYELIASYKDENNLYHALAYLGRVHGVALNYGDTIYHQKDVMGENLRFTGINPFGNKWNEMNENIFYHGMSYTFNPSYGSYLYGSNSSFTNKPIFLSDFESGFNFVNPTAILDDGKMYYLSTFSNFNKTYEYAEREIDEKVNVPVDADDGYYRIALTCCYDVYVSLTFEKMSADKLKLAMDAKFMFSPDIGADKFEISLQYSEDGKFVDTFDTKIDYSNKLIYEIGHNLNWGN